MIRNCISLTFALIALRSLGVEVTVDQYDATCFQCNGFAFAYASGGIPPYSYVWSPAPPTGQGTSSITGLCPGEYSVQVTDGMGQTAVVNFTINMLGGLNMFVPAQELQFACDGGCTGWAVASLATMGGTPPYTFDHPFPQVNGNSVTFGGLCPGTNQITVVDANGCAGTIQTTISNSPTGAPYVMATSPACGSQPSGSATMPSEFGSDIAYWVQSPTFDSIYNFGNSTGPYVLGGIPPGTHTVYYWWNQGGITGTPGVAYCTTGTDFTIGSLTEPCGSVNGRVYHDADENCVFNGFDLGQPYRVLTIEPGGQFTVTDANGLYQRNLAFDTYSIQQPVTPDEVWLCPTNGSADFALDAGSPVATIDFANLSTVPHDLSVSLTSTNARPGFGTHVWLTVTNNSAFPSGQVSIALSYDAVLLSPSTSSWNLPGMAPYASVTYSFTANVPADISLLGTVLNYTATVSNTASEADTGNNTALLDVTIIGSYDPNDKRGTTSSGLGDAQYFLAQDEWIDYTVRFQNTGTAAAETVTIRDVIDEDLFIPSLRILGASHAFTPSFGDGRELVFTFADINLPDSTTDLLGSQGFISFRLKPNSDITVGDMLENTAGIYFDFNPPIITNTVSHVVDFSTAVVDRLSSVLRVVPNPAVDRLQLLLPDGTHTALSIHAADGRSIPVHMQRNVRGVELDVSALSPGLYTVRTARGSARFVKQ